MEWIFGHFLFHFSRLSDPLIFIFYLLANLSAITVRKCDNNKEACGEYVKNILSHGWVSERRVDSVLETRHVILTNHRSLLCFRFLKKLPDVEESKDVQLQGWRFSIGLEPNYAMGLGPLIMRQWKKNTKKYFLRYHSTFNHLLHICPKFKLISNIFILPTWHNFYFLNYPCWWIRPFFFHS